MLSTDPKKMNEQMMQADPGYWALASRIKLQAGQYRNKGFEYQMEPMSSDAKRICYMKARQCFGATISEVLKDLHGMIMGKYKLGVAHIFPTTDEVGEFSKSIFKPLIANNKAFIGKYVKNVAGTTDTTSLKKVCDAFLFLRGARLSQKVGGSTESTSSKTAGFSCDKVVFDEVDFMDPEAVVKYCMSMGMSPWQHEVYLGNPSHEDFGIDLIFKKSDQRHWFRKCSCGEWTCAELSFPGCVKIRPDGTGYVGCDKCGKEVKVWAGEGTGEWVPMYKEKSAHMHGYMASQLMTPFNDPADILEDYTNPPFGNLADVCRLRLGRAHSARDEKLRIQDVRLNCGSGFSEMRHSGPCAMGVDVGKIKHVVIGIKRADGKHEIVRAMKPVQGPEAWDEMLRLIKNYNIESCVVDIRPYEDEARNFQRRAALLNCKVFLCDYSEDSTIESNFNEDTGVVKAHRTGIFDQTHRLLSNGDTVLPARSPEIDEFIRQCCNCAKFEEKDKRKNTMVYRYRPTGDQQEHFRNALNYFVLACSGHRVGTVSRYPTQTYTEVDNAYERV